MVRRFSCRDNAIVTRRTGSYYSCVVNPDDRVPGSGRMAGITTGGAGDMRRRLACGVRAVVTGITVSYHSRMVHIDDRFPPAG